MRGLGHGRNRSWKIWRLAAALGPLLTAAWSTIVVANGGFGRW